MKDLLSLINQTGIIRTILLYIKSLVIGVLTVAVVCGVLYGFVVFIENINPLVMGVIFIALVLCPLVGLFINNLYVSYKKEKNSSKMCIK